MMIPLLRLAFPLMLSWISTTLMMFVDRLILAQYSLSALGAAVNAGTLAWGFLYGFQIFIEMAQVVVAQYKGAKQHDRMTQPVWQMLYLVLLSPLLFVPLALFGPSLFFDEGSLQHLYFYWLAWFGPSFGLIGVGSAYFIGIGKGRMVTIASVVGNLVNLVLDLILIFGVEGWLEPMGIKGAAIATGVGMSVQGVILVGAFLLKEGVVPAPLTLKGLKPCFRVGVAPGASLGLELIAWGLFYSMMAEASQEHLLVTGVCQCLLPLLAFAGIGLQKAIASQGGHLIGEGRVERLPELLFSGVKILLGYLALLLAALILFPEYVLELFIDYGAKGEEVVPGSVLAEKLEWGLLLTWGYLLFGGIRSVVTGALLAAADSRFLTLAGTSSVWVLLLVPTYYVVLVWGGSVTIAQGVLVGYGFCVALIYSLRFQFGGWREKSRLI